MATEVYSKNTRLANRYHIYDVIQGGFGVVYLCFDLQDIDFIALKTLKPDFANQLEYRRDFKDSAMRSVYLGKHPNIVHCLDYVELEGQYFLVMEFVAGNRERGAELADWLKKGALAPKMSMNFLIDILHALLHAQNHGVLAHRDIKPQNVLITTEEVAKLTDFGIALMRDKNVSQPRGRGSPHYMAPEQWQNRIIDERVDVYSLGCLLYEMLSGKKLFPNESLEELRNTHLSGLDKIQMDKIPEFAHKLVLKASAVDRDDRYQTLKEMLDVVVETYRETFKEEPRTVADVDYKVDDYIRRAHLYYRVERYEEAVGEFNNALKMDIDNPDYLASRAVTYAKLNDKENAEQDLKRALLIEPKDKRINYLAGLSYRFLKQYKKAIEYFDIVLEQDPQDHITIINSAICLHLVDDNVEAVTQLTHLINSLDEDDDPISGVYFYRALAYASLERYQDALRDFTREILNFPDTAETYQQRAKVYTILERNKEALRDFDSAIRLDPEDPDYYITRASLYRQLNLFYEALADIEVAIKLGTTSQVPYKDQGYIYFRMREYENALTSFKKALELEPNDVESMVYCGRILIKLKRSEEALDILNTASEINPNYLLIWETRADWYIDQDQNQLAMMDVMRALQIEPQNPQIHFQYGVVLFKLERYTEAAATFMTVIGMKPDYAHAHANLATCYLNDQRYQQAEMHFYHAIQLDHTLLRAKINLGILKQNQNNFVEALQLYNEVAQMGDPTGIEMIKSLVEHHHFKAVAFIDPIAMMREAIENAQSLESMRVVVRRFPYMLGDKFDKLLIEMFSEQELEMMAKTGDIQWLRLAIAEQRR